MRRSVSNNNSIKNTRSGFRSNKVYGNCDVRNTINDLRISSSERRADMWVNLVNSREGNEVFKSLLVSQSSNYRPLKMEALFAMQLMGKDGIGIMRDAYYNSDSWTRSQLVGIFSTLKSDDVVNELITAVDDKTIIAEKRILALNSLSNASPKNYNKILKLLDSKDPSVRSRVAKMVGKNRIQKGYVKLKKMLITEKEFGVLSSVIEALNDYGDAITIEQAMSMRSKTKSDLKLMEKVEEIKRKMGKIFVGMALYIIAVLYSLGYSVKKILRMLNLFIKKSTLNNPSDDDENL
jgi:HEAT repeat protein